MILKRCSNGAEQADGIKQADGGGLQAAQNRDGGGFAGQGTGSVFMSGRCLDGGGKAADGAVIFVCGQTATGKSAYAVNLALELGGEIISCDSMQIYRGADIGTAKITRHEMRGVPHHMIDILHPSESFNVAQYKAAAVQIAGEIAARGKVPIFCGGTGLYANAVLFDYGFNSSKGAIAQAGLPKINARVTVLTMQRERLKERLERRVNSMFEAGLEDEVKALLQCGAAWSSQCMRAIGYREFRGYFEGGATLGEVRQLIIKNTGAYAKRQGTWFRSWRGFAEYVEV